MVMLERALAIEEVFNRVREIPGGPRTVDVDVICVGERRINTEALTLPHPRAHLRAFVLVPWLEADPSASLVGHGPVAELVRNTDTSGVVRRTDLRIE